MDTDLQQDEEPKPLEVKSLLIQFDTKDEDKESSTEVEVFVDKQNSTSHLAAASIDETPFTPDSDKA